MCEDCLYADVCAGFEVTQVDCDKFKEKAKFVELPCKVGDTVYFVYEEFEEICRGTIVKIELNLYTLHRNPIWLNIEYKSKLIGLHTYCCPSSELNRKIFFTYEAAEKALKEGV